VRTLGTITVAACCGLLLGCGGSKQITTSQGPRKPSQADILSFNAAALDVSNQCLASAPDEIAMSGDVTTILALYRRDDPNSAYTTPSGSKLTMREAIDTIIAGLQTCDPTLGQRLQAGAT
jgi:hypothetical protein